MESGALAALAEAYANIDILVFVAARLIGFLVIMPVLAGTNTPMNIRIILAIAISFIVVSSEKVTEVTYSPTIAGLALLLLKEFAVGFLIAFMVYLIFSIVYFVGQLIDMQIGFSMANVMDPLTQQRVPIVGNLLYFLMCALFVRSGGLNSFIQTVFYSFEVLPVGKALILGNGAVFSTILDLMTVYIIIGVQFSLPIVGSILVLDIALGLLIKASPQMNIFVVGMPIKLLVGLFLLYIIAPAYGTLYNLIFNTSFEAAMKILRGMMLQ